VELLLTGRCGVLMLDMGAVSTQPASLVAQIVDQFPDVVVVVAGRRDDEPLLAQLVSDGHVYRFMHKPLSPKRAGMFLQAAIRAHLDRRAGRDRTLRLPGVGTLPSRFDPRKWLFVGGGLALFVAALAAVLVARHDGGEARNPAQATPRPDAAHTSGPRADPVLSRARAALAAGRYESPPGRNALDLYAAVLLARPGNAEAREGLTATVGILMQRAEAAMASGDATEARRLAQRVLSVSADHAQARELLARLETPPAAMPAQAEAQTTPAVTTATGPDSSPAAAATRSAASATRDATQPVAGAGGGRQVPQRAAPAQAEVPPVAASPAPAAAPRKARVTPDPLTPRIITSRSPTRPAPPVGRSRSYGAPISSGHAVAGFAAPAPAPSPVLATATSIESPDSGSVPAVPARDLEALVTPGPVYPPQALRDRIEGWAEVEFTVDERGATGDIVVVAAEPRGVFDAAAIAAVAAWRYLPRVVNGRPVAQRTSVTLRFNVED
jgi:protein TonB